MNHINDNVYQNIQTKTMSITSYDTDHKFHKHEMDIKKKESII